MTPDDGLEALLAEHWSASTHTDRKPYVDKCDGCGAVVLEWGQPIPPDAPHPLAAHQAAVIRAAGWVKGREEWGLMLGSTVARWTATTLELAQNNRRKGERVVRRTVSDWEEAE